MPVFASNRARTRLKGRVAHANDLGQPLCLPPTPISVRISATVAYTLNRPPLLPYSPSRAVNCTATYLVNDLNAYGEFELEVAAPLALGASFPVSLSYEGEGGGTRHLRQSNGADPHTGWAEMRTHGQTQPAMSSPPYGRLSLSNDHLRS